MKPGFSWGCVGPRVRIVSTGGNEDDGQVTDDGRRLRAAAVKHHMVIVSFDSDFDRTERGRKTPAQILEETRS